MYPTDTLMGWDPITVLVIGDTEGDTENDASNAWLRSLLASFRRPPATVIEAGNLLAALERLRTGGVDLLLLDLTLPGLRQAGSVAQAQAVAPAVPILVLTGTDDEDEAIRALKEGAQDTLVKTHLEAPLLARAIRFSVERKRAEEAGRRLLCEQAARNQAEHAAERSRKLFQMADVLDSSLDSHETLPAVADLLVPDMADQCVLEVDEEIGERWRIERVAPGCDGPCEGATLEVSLQSRGRPLGRLVLARKAGGETYSADDVAFAHVCARKIALAVDSALLYRAREEVIGVVSHDLRNPLNVISLAAQTLERLGGDLGPAVKHAVKIRRGVERMRRLIEDLLDITRLDGGGLPMNPRTVDVPTLLDDACDHLRAIAEEKRITLLKEANDDLPAIEGDRERLLQVLSNLVGNALKFTPVDGQVTIAATRVDDEMIFRITDNGPGIPPEDLSKVFNRYWQGGREVRQGAGLGLAIARRIVLAHHGRITVESVVGAGSTFIFTIPLPAAGRPANDRAA